SRSLHIAGACRSDRLQLGTGRGGRMDLRFSADEESFRGEIRAFLRDELPEERPDRVEAWDLHRGFVKKLAARGWLTLASPRELSGLGASHIRALVLHE